MGEEGQRPGARLTRRQRMRDVLEFIERHHRERLPLEDVARAANFAPAYLTDLLRRETGLSVHRWIVEHRLSEAKRLLAYTEMPVATIAIHVGFTSVSHFSRQFLNKVGLTPRAWRKTNHAVVVPQGGLDGLASLLDAIPQLVWAKDESGNLFYANKRWYAFTGQTFAQSAGWGWLAVVHPSDVSDCVARWEAAIVSGVPLEYCVRLRRSADARYRLHLFRTIADRASDGTPRWIGTGTDVHDETVLRQASIARRGYADRSAG